MSIRRSVSWAFFFQGVTFVASFGGSVIVARLLSPAEIGINALAMAALGVVQVMTTFGLSGHIIRDPDLKPGTVDLAFSVNAVLSLMLAVILGLASLFSGVLLGDERAGRVMRLLMLVPLINAFGFRPSSMMHREMSFKLLGVVNSMIAASTAILTAAFAWGGASYMSSSYAVTMSSFIGSVGFMVAAPKHVSLRLSFEGWRKLSRFGLQMVSISGISMLASRLADVILGRTLGIAALGLYSRASMLNGLLFENIYGTATRVAFAKLAQDYRQYGEIRRSFLQSMNFILAVMWPLNAGIAVLSRPVVHILFGERWLAASLPLSVLLVGQSLALSFGMNWELFVLRHETARQARLEIKRAVFGFAVFAICCRFGLVSAALGRLADSCAGWFIYRGHVRRLADVTAREMSRLYAQNGVLALAAATPPLAVMVANNWSSNPGPGPLIASILLGLLSWIGAIVALRHPLLWEAAGPISRLSPRIAQSIRSRAGLAEG